MTEERNKDISDQPGSWFRSRGLFSNHSLKARLPQWKEWQNIEVPKGTGDEVQEMVRDYDHRRRVMVKGFRDIGLSCFEPKGAFYAFPAIKVTGMTSEEFSEKPLFEEKVAVVPGTAFGPSGEGYIRCCYATSQPEIEEALKRMGKFI